MCTWKASASPTPNDNARPRKSVSPAKARSMARRRPRVGSTFSRTWTTPQRRLSPGSSSGGSSNSTWCRPGSWNARERDLWPFRPAQARAVRTTLGLPSIEQLRFEVGQLAVGRVADDRFAAHRLPDQRQAVDLLETRPERHCPSARCRRRTSRIRNCLRDPALAQFGERIFPAGAGADR